MKGKTIQVNLQLAIAASALLRPTRAASLGRFLEFVFQAPQPTTLAALAARADGWSKQRVVDDPSAALRLVGEDLATTIAALPEVLPRIEAWAEPRQRLEATLSSLQATLAGQGVEVARPAIHLVDALPEPYNPPMLTMISIDSSDAQAFGLQPGIYIDRRRLRPFFSESTLGHLLVHVALAERSPELLGRGFEEGLAEVLGGLWAASDVIGADAAQASFNAHRRTPTSSDHRRQFLDAVGSAAVLHRRFGLAGLCAAVRGGRPAVKAIEAHLASGQLQRIELPRGPVDPDLADLLDRVQAAPRPLAVSPLAFFLAPQLHAGARIAAVASANGIDPARSRVAARSLMEQVFVLVVSADGEILVDDIDLCLTSGALRYALPRHARH